MFHKHSIWTIVLSIIILFVGVFMAWVWVRAASTPLSTIGWQQVIVPGFGSMQRIGSMETYQSQMYAGTFYPISGGLAEIWRTADGKNWQQFTPAFTTEAAVFDMLPFNNSLYVGTGALSSSGATIWRTDGTTWQQVASNGFGFDNTGINSLTVFSNTILAATSSITSGIQIWGSTTGDPGSWQQLNSNGFGLGINGQDSSMEVYNNQLYFGLAVNGMAALLRTDNLITWTPVFTNGLGNPNNTNVASMAEFQGDLYIGLRNLTNGGEVWRTSNGVDFSPVITGGLGDAGNLRPYGLTVYQNYLYLVFNNFTTGAEVWRTSDGNSWQQVNNDGWGDKYNIYADYYNKGATIFNDSLFFGTMNTNTGGEIWQLLFSPVALSISGPTSGTPGQNYFFTGITFPTTATLPLTYTWQATNFPPVTFTVGLTSTMYYVWVIPGTKIITATVENKAGAVTTTHVIDITLVAEKKIFLPTIIR
jgi:hypothetical protein